MISFTQLNDQNSKIKELSSVLNYLIENKEGAVPDKYIMYYRGQYEKEQVKQGKTR